MIEVVALLDMPAFGIVLREGLDAVCGPGGGKTLVLVVAVLFATTLDELIEVQLGAFRGW